MRHLTTQVSFKSVPLLIINCTDPVSSTAPDSSTVTLGRYRRPLQSHLEVNDAKESEHHFESVHLCSQTTGYSLVGGAIVLELVLVNL